MAGSDLNAHLDFQQAVRKYHEKIRLHFYPSIFLNKAVDSTDIKDYKLERYSPQQKPSVWVNLLSISILTIILIGTTAFNFKRQ